MHEEKDPDESRLIQINRQDYDLGSRSHGRRVAARVILSRGLGYQRRNSRFAEFLGLRPGQRIIEFGCGMGTMSLFLAEFGCEVTATDISQGELDLLLENGARLGLTHRVQTLQGSPEALPRAWHNTFDFALTSSVLHHVDDPHEFVKSMSNFLRPGGWCGGIEPNAASLLMRMIQEIGFRLPGYVVGSRESERNFHTSTVENLEEYARWSGLTGVKVLASELLPRPVLSQVHVLSKLDDVLGGSRLLKPLRTTLFWKGMTGDESASLALVD